MAIMDKMHSVIESCRTGEQLENARSWIVRVATVRMRATPHLAGFIGACVWDLADSIEAKKNSLNSFCLP